MFQFIQFLPGRPDDSLLYVGMYSPALVAASVTSAIVAAYAALAASSRIGRSQDRLNGVVWAVIAALTMGLGVWAMHFIGMMALTLPCGVTYDTRLTLLSMLPGVFASAVALNVAGWRDDKGLRLLFASLLLGAGIAAMHYMGMAAMRLNGLVRYDPTLFAVSIVVAVMLAYLALRVRVAGQASGSRGRDLLVAAIMGAAISAMHYTAMAAAYFIRGDALPPSESAFSSEHLAPIIIVVTGLSAMLVLSLSTISRNREVTRQLRESEQLWSFALEGTGDGVWDWDLASNQVTLSKAGKAMFGFAETEIGDSMDEWEARVHPGDIAGLKDELLIFFRSKAQVLSHEYRVQCRDGTYKWVLTRGMVVHRRGNGRVTRMIGTHADISERKKTEALIWRQANYDPLTTLPNRRMFQDRLEQMMKGSRRRGLPLALMLIDLDHFKEVNDTLGHGKGDVLLVEAARRISGCVRETDTVSRLGGDEFTVIIPEIEDMASVERIASAIIARLTEPFALGNDSAFVSASVGITVFPEDATEIDILLKNADQAMYQAKALGRNRFCYFTAALQEAAQKRMHLVNELRHALETSQFRLHYQPIVDLATGEISKAEALIRWQHPSLGLVSPAEFIPLAEENGLIVEIGEWVFAQAARQAACWRETWHQAFQISVNKSPRQFQSAGPSGTPWPEQLQALGLPGQSIVVEITEGLLLDAKDSVRERLKLFSDTGIELAIDDFGTGYSALAYLKKFDIDYIKIDRSFVRDLESDSDDMALTEAIVVMAHKLGLKVIAEGVETEAQCKLLRQIGCDFAQGYLFSHPLPAGELEDRLRDAGRPAPPCAPEAATARPAPGRGQSS